MSALILPTKVLLFGASCSDELRNLRWSRWLESMLMYKRPLVTRLFFATSWRLVCFSSQKRHDDSQPALNGDPWPWPSLVMKASWKTDQKMSRQVTEKCVNCYGWGGGEQMAFETSCQRVQGRGSEGVRGQTVPEHHTAMEASLSKPWPGTRCCRGFVWVINWGSMLSRFQKLQIIQPTGI